MNSEDIVGVLEHRHINCSYILGVRIDSKSQILKSDKYSVSPYHYPYDEQFSKSRSNTTEGQEITYFYTGKTVQNRTLR